MIELKQLNKCYQLNNQSYHALHNINLHIKRGEIVGIVGESGAGKSTLLRSVNLLEQPSSGHVLVDAVDLTQLSIQALKAERRKMGMIFQHFNLLESRTAFGNIALPLELLGKSKKSIQQEVMKLLELVKLTDKADHYPAQLSGGQKQRVAIARALATHPPILLCDEPTSALDVNSTASILSLLKEINQQLGVTILLITHELEVIKRICDRAGVLDHGRLVEYGSTLAIFSKPKTSITRQLVQTALHMELPPALQSQLQTAPAPNKACLVRFTFMDEDSNVPLMTTLVKKFDITINIIQAKIETIQAASVGFTVCQLSGDAIAAALDYVKQTSIGVEVLGYA